MPCTLRSHFSHTLAQCSKQSVTDPASEMWLPYGICRLEALGFPHPCRQAVSSQWVSWSEPHDGACQPGRPPHIIDGPLSEKLLISVLRAAPRQREEARVEGMRYVSSSCLSFLPLAWSASAPGPLSTVIRSQVEETRSHVHSFTSFAG